MPIFPHLAVVFTFLLAAAPLLALEVDDRPGRPGDWGIRPRGRTAVNPPAFSWRPQRRARQYELQVSRRPDFSAVTYRARTAYTVHCPPRVFSAGGTLYWRFRYQGADSVWSAWSRMRAFSVDPASVSFPMPSRETLLARIPKGHPRLFLRPEDLPRLRGEAGGARRAEAQRLVRACEKVLASPPSTEEPPTYPRNMVRRSEAWKAMWWGNRVRVQKTLGAAAELGFAYLLTGRSDFGGLAKRILLACAAWNPHGSTGYRYNDEAGMPALYYLARTYTFVHDLLDEGEREVVRRSALARGREVYRHLCPRHFWRPYSSHANRAWHFLGEAGVAFHGELEEAAEWVWFAMNVFYNVYPVWCDADGGWHEGLNYWRSYIGRFAWWAFIMKPALGVDAFRKPYFSQVGYYPLYLQPPGTRGGGFGDLNARQRSNRNAAVMDLFGRLAGNGHWTWYARRHGRVRPLPGFMGFLLASLPDAAPVAPGALPTSRHFRGTGQAALNVTLLSARDNVEILFKSSPFGAQSHGYEAQNAFLVYAFGRRLFIRSGRRDIYGSRHHKNWMWHTRSVNSITVNRGGQLRHSQSALGEISSFFTSEDLDYVRGDAAEAYPGTMTRFTRHMVFCKPDCIVVFDEVEAPEPARFGWHLHMPVAPQRGAGPSITIRNGEASARAWFLAPRNLAVTITDKFDPPPRPRVTLREWHLTARNEQPRPRAAFVTVLRPFRTEAEAPPCPVFTRAKGGYALTGFAGGRRFLVLLRVEGSPAVTHGGWRTDAEVGAVIFGPDGSPRRRFAGPRGSLKRAD